MRTKQSSPLLVQRLSGFLLARAAQYRVPLICAFLFGFLAHGFAFTNKLVNHDEVQSLFSKGATVTSGRWGLGLLDTIFPNVSMPWIYGIITIALLAVAVCLLISVLEMRSKLLQGLTAGFVLSFPSLTGTFGYMFTASSYSVAFLLAVLSVWCLRKKGSGFLAGAVLCMIASLSIYQSYVSLAAALLVLLLIRDLLTGEDAGVVLRRGFGYVAFLVASLGLYWAATQLILKLMHIPMGSYASESITFDLRTLPEKVLLAYRCFFMNFIEMGLALIPASISRRLHPLLAVCSAILLFLSARKCKKLPNFLLLSLLLVLFPLAINCMYLFTAEDSIHTLVLYSFVCLYLLIFTVADLVWDTVLVNWKEHLRRLALNGAVLLSSVILLFNTYVANEAYLNLYLRYENAYGFYSGLAADLTQSPEFTEGTRLAIIGNWHSPDFYFNNLEATYSLTGVTGFMPNDYSQRAFVEYYLGLSIPFASEAETQAIMVSPEFAEMPCYPYYGSMRKFGDIMVVKLS